MDARMLGILASGERHGGFRPRAWLLGSLGLTGARRLLRRCRSLLVALGIVKCMIELSRCLFAEDVVHL